MILMCCSRLPLDSPVTASPEISRNSSSSSNKRLQFETFPEGSRNDFSARCLRIMTHSSSWWSESCNLRSLQSLQQRKKLERLTAWKIYTQYTYDILVYLKRTSNHSGAILELYASPETEPRSDSSWRSCARLHTSLAKHNTARNGQKRPQEVVSWGQLKLSCKQYRGIQDTLMTQCLNLFNFNGNDSILPEMFHCRKWWLPKGISISAGDRCYRFHDSIYRSTTGPSFGSNNTDPFPLWFV